MEGIMIELLVPLDLIYPNPWQPREEEDPEHIRNLALSIAKDTMLQKPLGRLVHPDGDRAPEIVPSSTARGLRIIEPNAGMAVQLAFGHSRHSAYRWLRDNGLSGDWSRMPVVVRDIENEEMFRLAISENLQRRDLTPIEEARAMVRFRDEFGKTSTEIGGLFGISDSAVRNKIRLLRLPAVVQDLVRRRTITEGAARALIGLYDLPAESLERAEGLESVPKPSEIIEVAASGASPSQVGEMVERLTNHLNPFPEQLELTVLPTPEPEPIPAVSVETADEYEGETEEDDDLDVTSDASEESPLPPSVPVPAATPVHMPAPSPAPVAQPQPVNRQPAAAAPKPQPAPQPVAPATEPAKPLSWDESTITLAITLWPADGHAEGRTAVIAARVNAEPPRMQVLRELQVGIPEKLAALMEQIYADFGGPK
jgi:ParB/RepB/Spo0J family partition protein